MKMRRSEAVHVFTSCPAYAGKRQEACSPTRALAPAATMLACLTALESLRPQQGEDQVTQQAGSDEGGK
jgi:hypothetical protein